MTEASKKASSTRIAPLLLVLVTLVMLGVLELRHPWFFFQDDNRGQNLPYYVHNLRALLGGELPLFNFHQHLGTPVLSCIQSAAFYPLNYVALGLSKLFLGHYSGTMEFIALFHLVIAVLGFYCLMRHFGLGEAGCSFGAVAWAFCGFVMTAGNSWIQVLGYAAWFPWILLCSLRQIHGFDARNYLILAGLRTLDLFLGYPPFFAYTVMFDLLTVVVMYFILSGSGSHATGPAPASSGERAPGGWSGFGTFIASYFGNYLLVAGLSAAFLLPALHQVSISADRKNVISWKEYAAYSLPVGDWLHGLVIPFVDHGANAWFDPHFISHVGYLTLLFALVAVAGIGRSRDGRVVAGFCLLGAVALLWAGDIVVTKLFYHVPFYNRLRWPFKLTFFTSFYLIVIASFGFHLFRERIRAMRAQTARACLVLLGALHVANFLLLYLLLPQHMFSRHLDAVPLAEPLQQELTGGRIVSLGLPTVMEGNKRIYGYSVPQLGFNYPTLFGLDGFGGYELLLSDKNSEATFGLRERSVFVAQPGVAVRPAADLPLDYLREWGVRWYVVDRNIPLAGMDGLVEVHNDERRKILYDPAARPFVFWSDGFDSTGVTYRFRTNSVEIASQRESAGSLVVNVLHNPFFRATVDGAAAAIAETDDGQMRLDLPGGRHRVVVRYADPYFSAGLVISALTVLLAGAAYAYTRRNVRSRRTT
jgi:hypothetical protein